MIEQQNDPAESAIEQKPQWRLAGVIFFGLFTLLLLYAAFRIIWPFMTAILLGAILVTLTFGIFKRVRSRLKGSSTKAAIVMLLATTLLLVLPMLAPALKPMGVDPVHFSIIFTHNMEIGLVHPPVGLNLFVLSSIAAAPMGEAIRGILPFLVLLLIVLGVIIFAPVLTLWLPDAILGR